MQASNLQMVEPWDLDYADDFVRLFESKEHEQRALDRLGRAAALSGMYFEIPKYRLLA